MDEKIPLTPEQVKAIERANPCFKERHVESSRPGELLSQDTFQVGVFKGVGKVYCRPWSIPTARMAIEPAYRFKGEHRCRDFKPHYQGTGKA